MEWNLPRTMISKSKLKLLNVMYMVDIGCYDFSFTRLSTMWDLSWTRYMFNVLWQALKLSCIPDRMIVVDKHNV